MAQICEQSSYKRCEAVEVKPIDPWPPIRILERAADAECKVEQLLIEGEGGAAQQSKKAADEKQKPIDDDTRDASEAADKRKSGKNFEIETGMKRTGFSLDLPETTISFESTKIPTVHTKVARTKINLVVIGQCNVGSADIPEFRDFRITMETHTIYVPCPVTKDVFLSLPQFTLGETTINLPQITSRMVRKDISFHIPQFTYRDYEKVESDAEDKLKAERDLLQNALAEIKRGEGARTSEVIRQALKTLKENAEAKINEERSSALKDIAATRADLEQSRNEAKRVIEGAGGIWDDSRWGLGAVERGLLGHEAAIRKPYDDAQAQINLVFDGLVRKYLGHAIYNIGSTAPFCGTLPTGKPSTSLE